MKSEKFPQLRIDYSKGSEAATLEKPGTGLVQDADDQIIDEVVAKRVPGSALPGFVAAQDRLSRATGQKDSDKGSADTIPNIYAVPVRSLLGEYRTYTPVSPNRWNGESNCLVGPFSCHEVARRFADAPVEFGQYETYIEQVLVVGDSWYVEIQTRNFSVEVTV
ncbi:MAG: hypothetical protein JSV66_09885 [Trueperaceae bacterium]|nr:MAG: hypothetical protein JSV66_09885 [Trueperaceae bacterium]